MCIPNMMKSDCRKIYCIAYIKVTLPERKIQQAEVGISLQSHIYSDHSGGPNYARLN